MDTIQPLQVLAGRALLTNPNNHNVIIIQNEANNTESEIFSIVARYLNDDFHPVETDSYSNSQIFRVKLTYHRTSGRTSPARHVCASYDCGNGKVSLMDYTLQNGGWVRVSPGSIQVPGGLTTHGRDIQIKNSRGRQNYRIVYANIDRGFLYSNRSIYHEIHKLFTCMADLIPGFSTDDIADGRQLGTAEIQYFHQLDPGRRTAGEPLKVYARVRIVRLGEDPVEDLYFMDDDFNAWTQKNLSTWNDIDTAFFFRGKTDTYDIYTLDEEEGGCYLQDQADDTVYRIGGPRSTETHVNAHWRQRFGFEGSERWLFAVLDRQILDVQGVTIFVLVNEENIILDRMIVKRLRRDEAQFANDDAGISTEPREIFLHKRIEEVALSGHDRTFGRLRTTSYEHFNTNPVLSYQDYAPHSNLRDAMGRNLFAGLAQRKFLPETFIWFVFKQLVDACYLMQSRHMDPQAEYVYIHTDIKPQNIFIFEGIRDYYSVYKLPKLCDYGIYYRLGVEMVEGPSGTHGFMTPEHYDQARSGHSPLGVSVFEIGVIIFSMMMRYRDGFRVIEDAQLLRGNSVAAAIARIENEQGYALDSGMYSARLERLMRSCLSEDYRARPRIENLRREVTRALAAWDAAHGRLKGYNEGDGAPEMHQWLEVRFQDDLEFQRGRPWGPKRQNRHRDRGMGSTNWVSNDPKRRGPEDDEDEEDEDEDESV